MRRKIDSKTKVSAVKDYLTSGESLRVVSERHGISVETLRRLLEGKVRRRGRKMAAVQKVEQSKRRIMRGTPNAMRRWKIAEDEILRDAVLGNFTVTETMELLGRSRSSVTSRKHILLENGFIDEKRFKRGAVGEQETLVVEPLIEAEPKPMIRPVGQDFDIKSLAQLVQEFGVQVTMTVTPERTEIRIGN